MNIAQGVDPTLCREQSLFIKERFAAWGIGEEELFAMTGRRMEAWTEATQMWLAEQYALLTGGAYTVEQTIKKRMIEED